MDQLSDNDDFVPPTPKNQSKESLVFPGSKSVFNSSKHFKKPSQNVKRKKISGVSPDFKKFKDKSKQVSLFSYLKKEVSPIKKCNTSDLKGVVLRHPVKVKLFFDSNNTDSKTVACNTSVKLSDSNTSSTFSAQHGNEVTAIVSVKNNTETMGKVGVLSESSVNCDNKLFDARGCISVQENSSAVKPSDPCNDFSKSINVLNKAPSKLITRDNIEIKAEIFLQSEANLNGNEICKDVANLTLNFEDRTKFTNYSAKHVLQEDFEQNANKVDVVVSLNEDKNEVSISENSFSWLNEFDWKDCDTFKEMDTSVLKEPQLSQSKRLNLVENKHLFKVKEVYKNEMNELNLILKSGSGDVKTCILKGFWTDSLVNVGDSVHVLKEFEHNQAVIDNHSGFLVINPDFLLSSTAVVSTLFCMRKAALNHILPNWSSGNNIMMIGSLVHDIFQQAVNNHVNSIPEINIILENVLKKRENLICLSCQDTTEAEIKEKVAEYVPSIATWIRKHCAFGRMTASDNLQVTRVEGIEDNMWCPTYGVKGKIDMTVKAFFRDQGTSKVLPLELKTGRATYSAEHIGQINLYILMMEKRSKELSDGLLLYLKDAANMKLVSANHNSRRGLIQLRNELAFYTSKWISRTNSEVKDIEHCHLPEPLNNKKFCGKCPYLLPCTVYQRALSEDKDLKPDHAMKSLITASTSHLTSNHLEYFVHWSNLLLLESNSAAITNAFWTEESVCREKKGMCLSWLSLKKCTKMNQEVGDVFYISTFCRSADSPVTTLFTNVGLREGDYVAISKQGSIDEVAISMGYIIKVLDESIEVTTDSDFTKKYQDYTFRIDKQISNSATACIRNNLMRLMDNDNEASKLRSFIIDKKAPNFTKALPKDVVIRGRPILKELNKVQQRVILKALMAEDYFIIKGMPGTGKTSTIVALVRLLTSMGISVFLTSYTHSAIDNILLKLKEHVPFVRIGQEARIHPSLKQFSFESLTKGFSTADQFKEFMKQQMVVAATCLGINHAVFKVRKFDVCIVDEASQINQIASVGPLFHAKKFILVGDDKQLPPLVVNEKAREKGMQESLLQRLCNNENYMELVIQYRMNKEIMRFCNELSYGGALQSSSETIAQAVLTFNNLENITNSIPKWLISALQADLQKSVIFLNTDNITAAQLENVRDKNVDEADLVVTILQALLKLKVFQSDIGIITPYRRQVDLIEGKLRNLNANEIEVNTVDQYQGRDKDIIIISCVKCDKSTSNSEKKGIILDDERRLNVAISRAKRKLIIIGSKSTLSLYEPFGKLIKLFLPEQIIDLPSDFILS